MQTADDVVGRAAACGVTLSSGRGRVTTQMAFKNKQCHCVASRAKKVSAIYTIMTETGKILFKLTQEEIIKRDSKEQ